MDSDFLDWVLLFADLRGFRLLVSLMLAVCVSSCIAIVTSIAEISLLFNLGFIFRISLYEINYNCLVVGNADVSLSL